MRRFTLLPLVTAVAFLSLPVSMTAQATPPGQVTFQGGPNSPISSAVAIPAGAAWVWTSGTVPNPVDPNAPAGSRARYGDTKTQAISTLKAIEAQLKESGLTLKDVVYLRAYLVTDKEKGSVDFPGWFQAYGMYFNTPENPTRVARSTVAVTALVSPDWLIEIEAVAVFPKPK